MLHYCSYPPLSRKITSTGIKLMEDLTTNSNIVVAKVIVIVVAILSRRYMPRELLVLGFTLHSVHLIVVIHSGGKLREGKN
jgi:hypothetical protein